MDTWWLMKNMMIIKMDFGISNRAVTQNFVVLASLLPGLALLHSFETRGCQRICGKEKLKDIGHHEKRNQSSFSPIAIT